MWVLFLSKSHGIKCCFDCDCLLSNYKVHFLESLFQLLEGFQKNYTIEHLTVTLNKLFGFFVDYPLKCQVQMSS